MTVREDEPVLIHVNCATAEEAEHIGRALIEARLAAGINMQPDQISMFCWKGEFRRVSEVAMTIKTTGRRAEQAMTEIARMHSYETPAILLVPVSGGAPSYCDWIRRQIAN